MHHIELVYLKKSHPQSFNVGHVEFVGHKEHLASCLVDAGAKARIQLLCDFCYVFDGGAVPFSS